MAIKESIFKKHLEERRPSSSAPERLRAFDVLPLDKPITNRQQTDNKPINPITNRQQTDNKLITEKKVITESDNKPISKPITPSITKRQQTDNKPISKPITIISFSGLSGISRNIVLFIYEQCKTQAAQVTGPLSLENISLGVGTNSRSAKMLAWRLVNDGILIRVNFKNGRGGWTSYGINLEVYQEIARLESGNKLIINRYQTDIKPITQPLSKPITSAPNSNSLDIIKIDTDTTTWIDAIDFSEIEPHGFSKAALQTIARTATDPDIIQESIHAFAHDKRVGKAKLGMSQFTSVLAKGNPYNAEDLHYISPRVKRRKAQAEAAKKQLAELEAAEEEWLQTEFKIWKLKMSPEEFVRRAGGQKEGTVTDKMLLVQFKDECWPTIRQEGKKDD